MAIDMKATHSLYDVTGDIKDINTMLVPKQSLEAIEKDAARYQWLKRDCAWPSAVYDAMVLKRSAQIQDQVIDAACEKEPQGLK